MLRLNALLSVLVLALSACIESPPPSFQPVVNADMATDTDPQSDMGEDVVIAPDMPDIDEPICFGEGDCPNDLACKVNAENNNLNECVECVDADDCTMGFCRDDNTCVACIEDADCGDSRLTCSDANECIGCLAGATCPEMANRCDPDSEAPGTCVECLGDGNDTLCGEERAECDSESRRCVPCLPGDDALGTEDTCAANVDNKHCNVVDEDDSLQNTCVECLVSEHCASGGCNTNTNTCVTCVLDSDCAEGTVCTTGPVVNARMCVACLGDSCDTGVCKEDLNDPSQNTCVECVGTTECATNTNGKTSCNLDSNTCVECLDDGPCGNDVCKISTNTCVECLDNTKCPLASASLCGATNACVGCQNKGDCAHITNTNQCKAGTCVQCTTATELGDCNGNVCNPATNTCTVQAIGTTLALNTCVSDTQCQANHACIPLMYDNTPHGNYCMPIYTLGSGSCPKPYGEGAEERTSVNGTTQFICMISEARTSPEAIIQYSTLCTGNPSVCDASGSTCRVFNITTGASRCTYSCIYQEDCIQDVSCLGTINRFCGTL